MFPGEKGEKGPKAGSDRCSPTATSLKGFAVISKNNNETDVMGSILRSHQSVTQVTDHLHDTYMMHSMSPWRIWGGEGEAARP